MKSTFTKSDLHKWLSEKWSNMGCEVPDGERLGVSIPDLVEHSATRGKGLDDEHFELWIAIFDEFVSWVISVATIAHWHNCKRPYVPTKYEKCVVILLMRIIADSLAIRQLMTLGFDAAARIMVRSTSEHMEVLVAIINDPQLADHFEKTRTPLEANRFWKSHVAKNKIRPRIRDVWDKFLQGEAKMAKWFANWGSRGYSELSAISHPSLMGCAHAIIPAKVEYTDENWLGMWGDKSLSSIGTIETYISFLFPMLLAIDTFPFGKGSANFLRPRRYRASNELHMHIRHGRSVLGSLVLSLQLESNQKLVYPVIGDI